MEAETAWLESLHARADFYTRGTSRGRRDTEFPWDWFRRRRAAHLIDLKRWLRRHRWAKGISTRWLEENSTRLWETRQNLADELSRRLFDDAVVLKIAGYRRFYFSPEAFDDLFVIEQASAFEAPEGFPDRYVGLRLMDLVVRSGTDSVRLVVGESIVEMLNSYRQYFVHRAGTDFSPKPGEVVLDCGACIGDVGLLFAALTGPAGHVHMFDPIPAHVRFCQFQATNNPSLKDAITVVPMAVGAKSNGPLHAETPIPESNELNPAAVSGDQFPFVSIDDYVAEHSLRVDYIKMDIEGGELAALDGAAKTIAEQKPRLAISAYHKDDDLWTIREKILALNPGYRLHFGHHTPVQWESVFYAV